MAARLLLPHATWAEMAPILAAIQPRAGRPRREAIACLLKLPLSCPHGDARARSASRWWALGRRLPSLSSLGSTRYLAQARGTPPDGGLPCCPAPLERCDMFREDGHVPEARHSPWI